MTPQTYIEVSDDKEVWYKRKFIGMDGLKFVARGIRTRLYFSWRYGRIIK